MSADRRIGVEDCTGADEDVSVHFMTAEEAWSSFDSAAQYYVQMSGQEFIRAYDSGEFDHDPERLEVSRVAMLRPIGR